MCTAPWVPQRETLRCNYINDTMTTNGAAHTQMGTHPQCCHCMIILHTCMDVIMRMTATAIATTATHLS
jgi:hypothetical protein